MERRKNRIWKSNKFKKPFKSIRKKGRIVPKIEKCLKCGKNNTNHHYFCDKCWNRIYGKKKNGKDSTCGFDYW